MRSRWEEHRLGVCVNTALKIFNLREEGGGDEGIGGRGKPHNEAGHETFSVPNIVMIKSRRMVKGNVISMEENRN
jgi:hypothetical protein